MADEVKYTNGWTLSIEESCWECGDGCCTEYSYNLILFNDNGEEVERWKDCSCSPESLINEIESDYELVDVEEVEHGTAN